MACFFVILGVWKISVSVVESESNILSEVITSFLGLEVIIFDILEIEVIDKETSWKNVILVHVFNEGFNACSFNEFLLGEASLDLSWVTCDTSNEKMWESVFLNSIKCTLLPSS